MVDLSGIMSPAVRQALLITQARCGFAYTQIAIIYRARGHHIAQLLPPPEEALDLDRLPLGVRKRTKRRVVEVYEALRRSEKGYLTPRDVMLLLKCSYPTARKYLDLIRQALGMPPRRWHRWSTLRAWEVLRWLEARKRYARYHASYIT